MFENLLKNIDRLIAQRPVSKDALVSFRELVGLMGEVAPQPGKIQVEGRLKDLKKEEGFPLFSRNELPLDFEASSALMSKFLVHLAASKRADVDGLKKAFEQTKGDSDWAMRLFRAVLEKDEENITRIEIETDLDPKALQFLAQLALKPSLQTLRNAVSEQIDKESWDYGYCPLCGSQPNMAYFDKTGKRHLHCELCGEEWLHPRLSCPFCQTQEQKSLGYFDSEQEEGFRVDFCRKCHRYIKTVDKRIVEDAAPMEVEYLATIHLDLVANKHGFK
jgi:FdhE protein